MNNLIKEDCLYFYYDEDMGKSFPFCRITKTENCVCNCDRGDDGFITSCAGCNKYIPKPMLIFNTFEENDPSTSD